MKTEHELPPPDPADARPLRPLPQRGDGRRLGHRGARPTRTRRRRWPGALAGLVILGLLVWLAFVNIVDVRLRRRHPRLGLPARDRPLRHGPDDRDEGDPVLPRLRPPPVELPARRDRVRRAGAAARRLRAHHRHEQPRRGAAGRRGPHLPPEELPAADARDLGRLADAPADRRSSCCSPSTRSAASSSSTPGAEVGAVEPAARPPSAGHRGRRRRLSHRRRRRRRPRGARRRRARRTSRATSSPSSSSATAREQTIDGRRSARTPTESEPATSAPPCSASAAAAPPSGEEMSLGDGRRVQRHRPVPGGVGVDQGRRQGAQPGEHRQPPQRRDRRPRDPSDHGRRHHPGQRHDRRDRGARRRALPARRAERVRRRVQHVPAAAARRRPRRDRHLRARPRARRHGATSPTCRS